MGVETFGKTPKGYYAGMQRRLRPQHHRKKTSHLRSEQSRSERKNETDRLLETGRQSLAFRFGDGYSFQGDTT